MIITKYLQPHTHTHKLIPTMLLSHKIHNRFSSIYNMEQIKNHNISFETIDWAINLYPFYPQLRKKRGINTYEISAHQIVLAFVFVDKTMEINKAWALRKSMVFNFDDCSRFADLKMGSDQSVTFSTVSQTKYTNSQKIKKLILTDNPKQEQVNFRFTEQPLQKRTTTTTPKTPKKKLKQQDIVSIDLPYIEYRVMHKLIQKSLIDLGGWTIVYDLNRKLQFDKLHTKDEENKAIDQIFYGERIIQ